MKIRPGFLLELVALVAGYSIGEAWEMWRARRPGDCLPALEPA